MMKSFSALQLIIVLFCLTRQQVASTNIFVTPYSTCFENCQGDLTEPYSSLLLGLQAATSLESPVIILLASETMDHYVLPSEEDASDQTLLYNFSGPTTFNFSTLEIKPLFCDEEGDDWTLPENTTCIDRDQKITVYLKKLKISISVQSYLNVQNIVFNGIEAIPDYNKDPPQDMAECTQEKTRCCLSPYFVSSGSEEESFDPEQSPCNPADEENSDQIPIVVEGFFFVSGPELSTNESYQEIRFTNMDLQYFWGKGIGSFVRVTNSPYFSLTFENCTLDDIFFEQGLVYISQTDSIYSDSSFWNYSDINFKSMIFSSYNIWQRYACPVFYNIDNLYEGYLLFVNNIFKGYINILDSDFSNMASVSACDSCYSTPSTGNKNIIFNDDSRANLANKFEAYPKNEDFVSSFLYIEKFAGEMYVSNSDFSKIRGIEGSVIKIQDFETYETDGTNVRSILSFIDSTFSQNFAFFRFPNILIIQTSNECPSVLIQNSNFINTGGCLGSYGNVGIVCSDSGIPDEYSEDPSAGQPVVQVMDSVFQNNYLAVSNSLALVGIYYSVLERNIFQENGGTPGDYIFKSFDVSFMPNSFDMVTPYFGQSTAVYLSTVRILKTDGNTFKGNWGPFQNSLKLGSSLTILDWHTFDSPNYLYLQLLNDKFIDHTGFAPGSDGSTQGQWDYHVPPIITISTNFDVADPEVMEYVNNDPWNFGDHGAGMSLIGVTFANNSVNYRSLSSRNTLGSMSSGDPDSFVYFVDNNMRYKSGFLRFLIPSEVDDESLTPQTTLDPWARYDGNNVGFSFVDGVISNNTLDSDGCLFPTLNMQSYLLDNLIIEGNRINPSLESQVGNATGQVSAENIIDTRAGIFCAFQKNAVSNPTNVAITANNLRVKDNIGPIFSLYPDELASLSITNSLFMNNTCEYTSSIISLEASNVTSVNNIFIQNTNKFGTVFTTSSSSFYTNSFTTYLGNDGRHASLIYTDNHATALEIASKVYWNTITPTLKLTSLNLMPQGGLYFASSSGLILQNSIFDQNDIYAGFVISTGANVSFESVECQNHEIYGASLLGNFLYESSLTISNTNLTNNSIIANPLPTLPSALLTVVYGELNAVNVRISEVPSSNIGGLLMGTKVNGIMSGISLSNMTTRNQNALMNLISSNMTVSNFDTDNTTSLFSLSQSNITLSSLSIQRLRPSTNFYLVNTIGSNLSISNLEYLGSLDQGNYLSLILGLNNNVMVSNSRFLGAVSGNNNKIFDLAANNLFLTTNSLFEYSSSDSPPTIFAFQSSQTVSIEHCVFRNTGELIQDKNTEDYFHFVGNTILADPTVQKITTAEDNIVQILNNNFLSSAGPSDPQLPTSQIQITDSSGTTQLQNNIFFSLYGSQAVVQIECVKVPYNIESKGDIFIDNVGSLGSGFHLGASLPSTELTLPYASINSVVFLLNNATESGKGGAIYQTTTTDTKQDTVITNSLFIKNSAELVGGAIYFDYMLPKVDQSSQFQNNSANLRPNHIGSYPVRLDYYNEEYASSPPALPSDSPTRLLQSSWENIPSGLASNQIYTFVLLDMFDQIFDSDNTSRLEVYPLGLSTDERYDFSNKLSITAENGTYVYDSFKFTYQTYAAISVAFNSTAIQTNRHIPLDPPLTTAPSFVVEVQFRGCQRGEYVITEGSSISCGQCQPGFWQTSPVPDALSCQECDSTSTFCLGADDVGPRKGYWRLNETSDIVKECPISGSCLGSEGDMDPQGKCSSGYRGNLCSNCIAGWAKIGNGACTNCNNNVWYYLRVVLVVAVQLVMIIKAVAGTMTISKEFNDNQKLSLNGAILIRVLTNYFQLVSLVAGIPVTWPNAIKVLTSASSQVSSVTENVFTLDCMFGSDEVNGVKVVYLKLLLTTVGPFALILLGIICTALYFVIKRRPIRGNKSFKNLIISFSVIICFMMQPSAIQTAFSIFQCNNLYRNDSPAYYLAKDYDVQCWEGSHLYWALGFGIPILGIWAISLPLIVFNALRKNKDKLENADISQKYSFLYGGYRSDKYYWELVIMFRKFLLISITLGASFQSMNLQIYVSILLILFWFLLHLYTRPYEEYTLNRLEQFALISAGLVNFCGLYFKFVPSTLGLDITVIVCGLVGNLIFFVYFAMLYFALQIEKIKQNKKVLETLAKIGKKYKWINPTKIEKFLTRMTALIDGLTKKAGKDNEADSERQDKQENEIEVVEAGGNPYAAKRLPIESLGEENIGKTGNRNEGDESPLPFMLRKVEFESSDNQENHESQEGEERESLAFNQESERGRSLSESVILNLHDLLAGRDQSESITSANQE